MLFCEKPFSMKSFFFSYLLFVLFSKHFHKNFQLLGVGFNPVTFYQFWVFCVIKASEKVTNLFYYIIELQYLTRLSNECLFLFVDLLKKKLMILKLKMFFFSYATSFTL